MIDLDKKLSNRIKSNAKVLLLHPAFHYTGKDCFPLGLGYIAAYLKQYTNNITIFDEKKFQIGRKYIEIQKPDIIGISCTTPSYHRVKAFLQNTIQKLPESIKPLILIGGTHATYCPDEVLRDGADLAFIGEADLSIQQLFEKQYTEIHEIPGLAFQLDEMMNFTPRPPLIKDMDSIPFPARELFDPYYSVMSLTTSRGCPYACTYCSATDFWQYRVRYHSVDYVERELEQIASHGYKFICFEDATFSVNIKRAQQICETIIENPKLRQIAWSCETRPDRLNANLLQTFEDSRCILINLGVESGSEKVLKAVNRTVSLDKLYEAIRAIQETKIPLQVLMVFGLPGENADTVKESISFLKEFKPNRIVLSLATAYPGTELWNSKRRVDLPLDWRRRFPGHGEFSPLYLSEELTLQTYKELAEDLLEVVQQINSEKLEQYRNKHKAVIEKTLSVPIL